MFNSLSDVELSIALLFLVMLVGIVVAGGLWAYLDRKR